MRRKTLPVKTILIIGLTAVSFNAGAAVATAKVSANVVPASSFSISKNYPHTITSDSGQDLIIQSVQTNSDSNSTDLSSNKTEVIVNYN